MPDREGVINGLEYVVEVFDGRLIGLWFEAWMLLTKDALALLKAQEAVNPVLDIDTWKCGNCGHALEHQQLLGDNVLFHEQYNYCPECGRAVKWV